MNKFFWLLLGVILFAKMEITLKPIKTYDYDIFAVKKVNNNFYIISKKQWGRIGEFKDFFVIDGQEILIGENNGNIYIKTANKHLKLKGKYIAAVKKDKIVYLATPYKVYGIDQNLNIVFSRTFTDKIDNLLLYKNMVFVLKGQKLKLLRGVGEIDFSDEIPALKARFLVRGGKLFAIYKNILKSLRTLDNSNHSYEIMNLTDSYKIELNEEPLDIKYIDGYLYLIYFTKIEKYKKDKLVWSLDVDQIPISLIKENKSIYVITLNKAFKIESNVKIKNLKCKVLDGNPLLISNFYSPLVLTRGEKYKITLFDESLNVLWSREINAKVNNLKVIGDFIYLIGVKEGRFWVEKMDFFGKVLKENIFYKSGQGFDIAKNDKGFVAVGYKFFDHLGDYIKRFVIVLLDKNLNFITDRTYGDFESVGVKVIGVGKLFFGLQKVDNGYFFVLLDKNGFLRWYKTLSFDRYYRYEFYDIKLLNQIFFSTDKGVFVLNSDQTIARFRDYTNVIKIIDKKRFITNKGVIIGDKTINFDDVEIIDGMYNRENYYFIGYENESGKGVVCEY